MDMTITESIDRPVSFMETERSLPAWAMWVLFPVCLGICAAFTIPGLFWVGSALTLLLMFVAIVAPTRAIPYVLVLMLIGPDITQVAQQALDVGQQASGSPWQIHLGPLTPGMMQSLVYLVALFRIGSIRILPNLKGFLAYGFCIGFAGLAVGAILHGSLGAHYTIAISDFRMLWFLILASCIFYAYSKRYPEEIGRLCQLLLLVLISRLVLDAFRWFTATGAMASGVSSGSADSTKWTTLVIIFWAIYSIIRVRKVLTSLILLLLALIMVFVYLARMNYVTAMLGFILLMISAGKGRMLLLGIPVILVILVVGSLVLQNVAPDILPVYQIRFRQLYPLLTLDFQAADPFRYLEFTNCFGEMAQDGTIIVGRGFGGYYTDRIMTMPTDLTSAFPPWVESTRHFPWVHFVGGQFILKFGIIGLGLWLLVWWRILKTLYRSRLTSPKWETIRILLLATTPAALLSGYWSSKGMILTGFLMVMAEFLRNHPSNERMQVRMAQ